MKKQIFKSSKWGRPWDPTGPSYRMSRGASDGTLWRRPRDVVHTYVLNPTQNHIKLILTGYSRFYSELQ